MACDVVTGSQNNGVDDTPTRIIGCQLPLHFIGGNFWSKSHLRRVLPVNFNFIISYSPLYLFPLSYILSLLVN